MSEDWHIKFLAVVECLDREADRLRREAAALSAHTRRTQTSEPSDELTLETLSRAIQDLA